MLVGGGVWASISNFKCDEFAFNPRPAVDKTKASKVDLPELCPRAAVPANPIGAVRGCDRRGKVHRVQAASD